MEIWFEDRTKKAPPPKGHHSLCLDYTWEVPWESMITQGTSSGQIFQIMPEDFPLFFRLLNKDSEDYEVQDSVSDVGWKIGAQKGYF